MLRILDDEYNDHLKIGKVHFFHQVTKPLNTDTDMYSM